MSGLQALGGCCLPWQMHVAAASIAMLYFADFAGLQGNHSLALVMITNVTMQQVATLCCYIV